MPHEWFRLTDSMSIHSCIKLRIWKNLLFLLVSVLEIEIRISTRLSSES